MKHARARNIIERTVAFLKFRCKILSSQSFYDIITRHINNVCCLLHNFIRRKMTKEAVENELDHLALDESMQYMIDNITTIEPTDECPQFRCDMAINMFSTWW